MKTLFKKEILLCTNAQIIIYALLALTILIPSYPPAVGVLYALGGLMSLFPRTLANKDIEYTALLPVKKTDVVKGKMLFLIAYGIATMIIAVIGSLIRVLMLEPSVMKGLDEGEIAYYQSVSPTVSLLGFGFLAFGIMNLVMISVYYRNPYKKLTAPSLLSLLAASIVLTIGQIVIAFVPALRSYEGMGLFGQVLIAAIGFLLFLFSSFLGYKIGAKEFEKIDL